MKHLPFELIVLLETDPDIRGFAERLVKSFNAVIDASAALTKAYDARDSADDAYRNAQESSWSETTRRGRKRKYVEVISANARRNAAFARLASARTEYATTEDSWLTARIEWNEKYPEWANISIRSFEEWLNGASTVGTDCSARD